jgi:hypothetical protein
MSFWGKILGKTSEESMPDPLADLVLEKLQPGYLVDHDGKTWEVIAVHFDDMGEGSRRDKWEIEADSQVWTLSREELAEGILWTLTRKVPLGSIDVRIRSHIQSHGDPPESLKYENRSYSMQSYGGAKFHRNGAGPPVPFLFWEYWDEVGQNLLIIEQWGDIEFEARAGRAVEEYQFLNILPRRRT